ncbi:hypothetical protein CYMTET_26734 [Cymbomonas tetramitiformis]|uniref:Uncharacterized protein n=1 Tax=Cymbomonas tetramitiformis TaxID=36881 RepID=A0AAE0KXY3_9CHLO|nr:hypothetical protein CYMTET_26734 [Cymbomonas tetramitiformis]
MAILKSHKVSIGSRELGKLVLESRHGRSRRVRRNNFSIFSSSEQARSVVSFRATRRGSITIPYESSAASVDEFLRTPASHCALLDSSNFYPVEASKVYKCRGQPLSILAFTFTPVNTVEIVADGQERHVQINVLDTELEGVDANVHDLMSISSSTVFHWENNDVKGFETVQLTSNAVLNVDINLPSWVPIAPSLLEAAGNQAVQLLLDDAIPAQLDRLLEAYTWWSGSKGASSPSRVWRAKMTVPLGGYSRWVGPVSGGKLASDRESSQPATSTWIPPPPAEPQEQRAPPTGEAESKESNGDTAPRADKKRLDTEVGSPVEEAVKEVPSDDAQSTQPKDVDYTSELLELLQDSKVEEIQGVDAEEAEKIKQFQEASKVLTTFSAKRTLVLPLREPMASDNRPKVSVEEYLKNPERLVRIVYNDRQFEKLDSDRWRIKLLAIRILSWSVVPVYELVMRFEDNKLLAQSGTVSLDPDGACPAKTAPRPLIAWLGSSRGHAAPNSACGSRSPSQPSRPGARAADRARLCFVSSECVSSMPASVLMSHRLSGVLVFCGWSAIEGI